MRHRVFVYFLILFLIVGVMGGSVLSTYRQFVEEGPLEEQTEIVIEAGRSLRKIAKQLYRAGIIASPSVFEIGARASGSSMTIKAGEYSIPKRASAKTVLSILTSGNTYIRRLVIPEGLTSHQIVKLMDGKYGLMGFVDKEPKNGSLMPDTYYYSYGDTKMDLLRRMQNGMQRAIEELWAGRDKNLSFKTPQEAVVMASMVEKETARDAERGHIASVFHNRLKKGMKLQSDPTVIFALTGGVEELKRNLTYRDLRTESGYNTYVVPGLPIGPISNPGYAALRAVLHPDNTDDLYFVADGHGGHVFSKTYADHERKVAQYREVLKAQKKTKTEEPEIKNQ
ncbi:MAG: endolytic transglycosylase MltG [Alphaproteobacteria bacterium]|nr:endolytic transglycosylase MltG [Alphaproteobacteria bacterium]